MHGIIAEVHIGEATPLHLQVEVARLPAVGIEEGIVGVVQPVNGNPDGNG